MLRGNCTEALSIQANVTISGSGAKLINNGIAPLPFPLPALLKQYWYIKRGEGQGEGHAPFYATLGSTRSQSLPLCLKIVVVSVASFKRNDVASSILSKANRICSPSTASTGWSDITTFLPIRPANMLDGGANSMRTQRTPQTSNQYALKPDTFGVS